MRDPVTISSLSILGGFHVFLMNRGPDLVNTANREPPLGRNITWGRHLLRSPQPPQLRPLEQKPIWRTSAPCTKLPQSVW